jgi:hypothetical protein
VAKVQIKVKPVVEDKEKKPSTRRSRRRRQPAARVYFDSAGLKARWRHGDYFN